MLGITNEESKSKTVENSAGFGKLVRSIAEYSYSVEYDNDGGIKQTYHSSNSKKITGYDPRDYYNDHDLWSKMIYGKDREKVIDFFNEVRNSKKEGMSNYYLEHRIRHKNGNIRWVSDSHNVIVENGKIVREEGFVFDITEHKEIEEELKQIINNAGDGIWVIDKNKLTTKCNPKMAKIIGISADELIGKSIFDFVDEKGAAVFEEMSIAREGGKKGIEFEVELLRSGGIRVPCLFSTASLKGETSASYAIVKNITRRKMAEDELRKAKEEAEEATKLKDKFVALVAHDLRSPLATQIGFIDILKKSIDDPNSKLEEDMIKRLKRISVSLLNMVDRLLDIGRLQTGKIKPDFEKIDLREYIRKIITNLKYSAEDKGIAIYNEAPEGTEIYADKALFAEVLQNLITNAIKFSSRGDSINIFMPKDKTHIIAVKDTGVGISKKRAPALFEYELSTSTTGTSGEEGAGLGLPICREIIEAHNGKIWVESEPGNGSVFYVKLPPES